jgi:hypothetical protein
VGSLVRCTGTPAGALHTTVTGRRCTQPWLAMLLQYDSSVLGLQVGDASCASVTAVLAPGRAQIISRSTPPPPPHLRRTSAAPRLNVVGVGRRRALTTKRAIAAQRQLLWPQTPSPALYPNIDCAVVSVDDVHLHLLLLPRILWPSPCPRVGSSTPKTRPSSAYVSCP